MKASKVSVNLLCRHTGVALTTIKRIQNDEGSNPTISTLLPIADFFNVTVNQLVGDKMCLTKKSNGSFLKHYKSPRLIPLISWEDALLWPDVASDVSQFETVSVDIDVTANAFALRIHEDIENFWMGSIIIVEPNVEPDNREFGIVMKNNYKQARLVKFLRKNNSIYISYVSKETVVEPFTIDFRLIGTLVQVKMNFVSKNEGN